MKRNEILGFVLATCLMIFAGCTGTIECDKSDPTCLGNMKSGLGEPVTHIVDGKTVYVFPDAKKMDINKLAEKYKAIEPGSMEDQTIASLKSILQSKNSVLPKCPGGKGKTEYSCYFSREEPVKNSSINMADPAIVASAGVADAVVFITTQWERGNDIYQKDCSMVVTGVKRWGSYDLVEGYTVGHCVQKDVEGDPPLGTISALDIFGRRAAGLEVYIHRAYCDPKSTACSWSDGVGFDIAMIKAYIVSFPDLINVAACPQRSNLPNSSWVYTAGYPDFAQIDCPEGSVCGLGVPAKTSRVAGYIELGNLAITDKTPADWQGNSGGGITYATNDNRCFSRVEAIGINVGVSVDANNHVDTIFGAPFHCLEEHVWVRTEVTPIPIYSIYLPVVENGYVPVTSECNFGNLGCLQNQYNSLRPQFAALGIELLGETWLASWANPLPCNASCTDCSSNVPAEDAAEYAQYCCPTNDSGCNFIFMQDRIKFLDMALWGMKQARHVLGSSFNLKLKFDKNMDINTSAQTHRNMDIDVGWSAIGNSKTGACYILPDRESGLPPGRTEWHCSDADWPQKEDISGPEWVASLLIHEMVHSSRYQSDLTEKAFGTAVGYIGCAEQMLQDVPPDQSFPNIEQIDSALRTNTNPTDPYAPGACTAPVTGPTIYSRIGVPLQQRSEDFAETIKCLHFGRCETATVDNSLISIMTRSRRGFIEENFPNIGFHNLDQNVCKYPDCFAKCDTGQECGYASNGCGNDPNACGICASNKQCNGSHQCECKPQYTVCGSECCDPANQRCEAGHCVCAPDCDDRNCGVAPNGCGFCPPQSSDGLCSGANRVCNNGYCACQYATCDSECCPSSQVCYEHACCDRVANCNGKQCGDDGCGGQCGSCGANETCSNGQCVCTPCNGGACCQAGEHCDGTQCVCDTNNQPKCNGSCCASGEHCDSNSHCDCDSNNSPRCGGVCCANGQTCEQDQCSSCSASSCTRGNCDNGNCRHCGYYSSVGSCTGNCAWYSNGIGFCLLHGTDGNKVNECIHNGIGTCSSDYHPTTGTSCEWWGGGCGEICLPKYIGITSWDLCGG